MAVKKEKANRNTYDISSITHVTRKCHIIVVQNNSKEMYQQVCCTCNVAFAIGNGERGSGNEQGERENEKM